MGVACGKIILFGEHAVVYGSHGIALPVKEVQIKVDIENADSFSFEADRKLYKEEKNRLNELLDYVFFSLDIPKTNQHIRIKSNIPVASGLGSSAALSVAIIRSLSAYFYLGLNEEKINKLAFECEKFFHGTPSGIDNAVVTYEKPVFYHKGKIEFIKLKKPLMFVIANSGIMSNTKQIVGEVNLGYKKEKRRYKKIFNKISDLTKNAKKFLEQGQNIPLGYEMMENHFLLKQLSVSCTKLDDMIEDALEAGAYGAKLAGSGKGGNIIALVDKKIKNGVVKALKKSTQDIIVTEVK